MVGIVDPLLLGQWLPLVGLVGLEEDSVGGDGDRELDKASSGCVEGPVGPDEKRAEASSMVAEDMISL